MLTHNWQLTIAWEYMETRGEPGTGCGRCNSARHVRQGYRPDSCERVYDIDVTLLPLELGAQERHAVLRRGQEVIGVVLVGPIGGIRPRGSSGLCTGRAAENVRDIVTRTAEQVAGAACWRAA